MGTTSGQQTFDSEAQARTYAASFEHAWFGYSPSTQVVQRDGQWIVYTSRWNSCD